MEIIGSEISMPVVETALNISLPTINRRQLHLNYVIGGSTQLYRHHPKRVQWIRHAIERPGYLASFVPIIGSLEYI
jgi:hypothetical protein